MPDVLMPRLSDTMEEGVVSQWLKHEGDPVAKGDILAEIETDKATMELEAFDDGVLERLLVDEGATVPIGQPVAVIGDGSGGSSGGSGGARKPAAEQAARPEREAAEQPAEGAEAEAAGGEAEAAGGEQAAQAPAPRAERQAGRAGTTAQRASTTAERAEPPAQAPTPDGARVLSSPLARSIARDAGLDLASVTGSGPGGRIVRADVEAAVAAAKSAPRGERAAAATPAAAATAPADDVEEVRLTAIRRITAERLAQSASSAPHFYLTSVVDVAPLLAFRTELNGHLESSGLKVSVTDLLVRACALMLRTHPAVNASWGGDKILRRRRVNVGVAVALDDGLIVPVVKDADTKGLGQISTEVRELARTARAGKLVPEQFTGGTFTISNLGMYGVDHFTAVINPPEAAILAVGAAQTVPVVRDGAVVVGQTMKLTLSIDHRVLDGATAAAFLRDLVGLLTEPFRIVI